uniref:Phosphatidylinositol-4-phosphate 3-kinase n=1 Tax=Panagrellus redivivus TaxID=6233 RepID=A0A7E4W115_PANRE
MSSSASNALPEDEQLKMALQLSRQTFEEEQRRRNCESPDLMLGDPVEIQRQKNMEEITAMFGSADSSNDAIPPYLQPRSTAALPYGFRPQYSFDKSKNRFLSNGSFDAPITRQNSDPSSSMQYPPRMPVPAVTLNGSASFTQGLGLPYSPEPIAALRPPPAQQPPSSPQRTLNHTQIVVPFRMRDGNFIDLDNAPAALDDPSLIARNRSVTPEVPELELDEILALIERSSVRDSQPVMELQPQPKEASAENVPKKLAVAAAVSKLELEPKKTPFLEQRDLLKAKAEKWNQKSGFFFAPTVSYMTTTAESIKITVHRDDTWPAEGTATASVALTYEATSTCLDLLIAVLCRFLPPESIGTTVDIDDFTLKVFGIDEFLDPKAIIGQHPFVSTAIARGKDVMLEIGKKELRDVNYQYISDYFKARQFNTRTLNQKELETHIAELNSIVETLDRSVSYPLRLRERLCDKVVEICKFCCYVQTIDVLSAMRTMKAVEVESHYQHARNNLLKAVHALVTINCDSTLSKVNLKPLAPLPTEIRDSRQISFESMLLVESLHNIPTKWIQHYKSYFVNVCLMHGTTTIAQTQRTECKSLTVQNGMVTVPFSTWFNTTSQIMTLPREVQVCIVIYGNLKDGAAANPLLDGVSGDAESIAFTNFPLFQHNETMLQGKVLLPLEFMERSVVKPWGPKPLIRTYKEPLIVVSIAEHLFQVQFPKAIEEEQLTPAPFSSLPPNDQSQILDMLEGSVSHTSLSTDDRYLLWSHRRCLLKKPEAFVPVLASAISWDCLQLSNVYALLDAFTPPEPQFVLDLLLPYFQDKRVRSRAVQIIRNGSSAFIMSLQAQLVEALRFEVFEDSDLAEFLLEQSTKDRRFAIGLYWVLENRALNEPAPYSTRCRLLVDVLLDLKIPNFLIDISCQKNFCIQLDRVCAATKAATGNLSTTARNSLYDVNDKLMVTGLRLPINPAFLATSINIEHCNVFASLTRPLRVEFVGQRSTYGIIYKVGDDIRQDAMVLQLIDVMNDIWLRENLDLRMLTYRVMSIGTESGIIELVNDCRTLREIQTELNNGISGVFNNDAITAWLNRHNPSEFNNHTAFDNFMRSCAGWAVGTYVLGIGDRHNDNILVSKHGHFFHIDFGKYMGDYQYAMGINRDRVPFVLTGDMVFAINRGNKYNTERFQIFYDYCCKAYNLLRRNCGSLLNIIKFMSCSNILHMDLRAVHFVEKNLMLDVSDYEATTYFTQKIRCSIESFFPRLNFFAHSVAQTLSNSASNNNKTFKNGEFSFTTEISTKETDGKIVKVTVPQVEKWRNPSKVYMFHFEIYRENDQMPTLVYRTYAECEELYNALVNRFSAQQLPLFENVTNIGRSNIRQVAEQRQAMLRNFFTRFFELAPQICHCDLIYTFFHAIHRDTNPETVKDIVYQNRSSNPASINIILTFVGSTNELKVFITHARNLPLVGGVTTTPPDSYVKTYIKSDYHRHSKRKTEVIRNTTCPTYNAHFTYNFESVTDIQRSTLIVSVWHVSASIVRDNYGICGTEIPLFELLEVTPDRKGDRCVTNWYNLC